ncbi:MAG TPA: low temperature requirement protein A, partial [Solirubrobacteraceae bacterium]|nr:low temperature requirement protein A [Solirubrobacteraceae bacterium]
MADRNGPRVARWLRVRPTREDHSVTDFELLFVILAIGESIVAIGVGAADQAISVGLLLAAVLGVAASICLWWLYFDVVSVTAERRFHEARGAERMRLAIEAYTYGHFPIVAGIIVAAIGVEGVLAHAGDS